MSYLDIPRIYFSGKFFTDPSTINNKPSNFNPDVKLFPINDIPFGIRSALSEYTGFPYINPNGLGLFYFKDCFIKGGESEQGRPINAANYPEVIGAKVETLQPHARMVDMDPDQQSISQIYGIQIKVTFCNNSGFYGLLKVASLTDLWYGRVPSFPGDSGASGFFQTVLPFDNINWFGLDKSPFLQSIRSNAEKGLSIKWVTDAYQGDKEKPDFNLGRITGCIGPVRANEPETFPAARRLSSNNSKFGNAFFVIDVVNGKLLIDLSNCVPLEYPAGEAINCGLMQGVILKDNGPHFIPSFINYSKFNYENNAGLAELQLSKEETELLDTYPLGIIVNMPFGGSNIIMRENDTLTWVNFDQSYLRLTPGDVAEVDFFARQGNGPLPGKEISFIITDSDVNNRPRGGITFDALKVTDENGFARLKITANSPAPLPPRRAVLDSQLYYIGGPWQSDGNFFAQSGGGGLSVLVFNDFTCPPLLSWQDHVEPLLSAHARMFPGMMLHDIDLGSFTVVKKRSGEIKERLLLNIENVLYIPVSRDMSPYKIAMIVKWINDGMPYTLQDAADSNARLSSIDVYIENEYFSLKKYALTDAKALFDSIRKNKIALEEYLAPPVAKLASVNETRALINSLNTDWNNRLRMIIPIWLKETGELAGELYIGDINGVSASVEVGYFLFPEYQGRGIAYDAVTALVKHLFNYASFRTVFCRCDEDNSRSIRLLKRLGFEVIPDLSFAKRKKTTGESVSILVFKLEVNRSNQIS
jgi:RimJ/RimL family protein N-acetyltransferase